MIIQFIWIAFIYGLAVASVHGVYARTHNVDGNRQEGNSNQYILITCNHERQVEWYVRALWLYSYLRSKEVRILVIDYASSDETVQVLHRMSDFSGLDLSVKICAGVNGDDINDYLPQDGLEGSTFIDLRIPQEAGRIPYVQG